MQQAKNKNTSIARGISGKIKSCLLYKTHITYEGIQTLYVLIRSYEHEDTFYKRAS